MPAVGQEAGTEQWSAYTRDPIESSPTVVDGTVYVGSNDNNLYAVDAETGERQWAYETNGKVKSSPTVVDGIVFVGSNDNHLYAIDSESGEQYWEFETDAAVESSPTVGNGSAYVGSDDGFLYSVDAETGEQRWKFRAYDPYEEYNEYNQRPRISASPTLVDGDVYISSDNIYSVSADTGEGGNLTSDFSTGPNFDYSSYIQGFASSVTIDDGRAYAGSSGNDTLHVVGSDEGWTFELDGVPSTPAVGAYKTYIAGGKIYAINNGGGSENWASDVGGTAGSSPTVANGTVFVGSQLSRIHAFDKDTGDEQWSFTTDGEIISSPTVVNGTVYVGSTDGFLYAINTGISGSSTDSRVMLGTLGHHNDWRHAGQSINIGGSEDNSESQATNETNITNSTTDQGVQSTDTSDTDEKDNLTGIVALATGSIATATVGGYGLYRWRTGSTEVAEQSGEYDEGLPDSLTQQLDTAGSELDDARTKRDMKQYDEAISCCERAISAVKAAEETAKSAESERASEVKSRFLDESLTLKQDIIAERDAYQSVNQQLESLTEKLDVAEDELDTGNQEKALTHVVKAQEIVQDINNKAREYNFEKISARLETERDRCNRIRTEIRGTVTSEQQSVPKTIPSAPRLSLSYDDIDKGELLGSGGNADVYRATTLVDSDEVSIAVKEPRIGGATIDTDTVDEMLEEAETWQQLDDHEHIVSVIDYASNPLPWIAMEYMDGGNLGERTDELSFEQALWTGLAITRGVRYAHKRGVAHLDLKPSNILFRSVEDGWDVPKVADWGLSKHLLEHSQSVDGMSPRYAAPEQLDSGQFGQTDTVTDVYQLGTVLYELFTGGPPFEGETYEVMNKIQSTTPDPPSDQADLPEAIDEILLTALATERTDRYEDVIYLRDALQDIWEEYN